MRNYKQFTGVTYPLCIDAAATRGVYAAFEANDVSMVIDPEGIVRYRGAGVNVTQIKSWIDNLLAMATNVEDNNILPQSAYLFQNYPNPFNPSTTIRFELPENQDVILQIFDIEGRLIKRLIDNQMYAGSHEVSWNGLNENGSAVASGVYYYVLKAGNYQSVKRMVLMR